MKNKRGQTTYKKATSIEPGVAICNVGYADCPGDGGNHYHCGQCGAITGMMGHYAGDGPMSCQMTDEQYDAYMADIRKSVTSR
jgi:hypothetical protein